MLNALDTQERVIVKWYTEHRVPKVVEFLKNLRPNLRLDSSKACTYPLYDLKV